MLKKKKKKWCPKGFFLCSLKLTQGTWGMVQMELGEVVHGYIIYSEFYRQYIESPH